MRVLKKILLWLLLVAVLAALIVGGAVAWFYYNTDPEAFDAPAVTAGGTALAVNGYEWNAPVMGGVLFKSASAPATLETQDLGTWEQASLDITLPADRPTHLVVKEASGNVLLDVNNEAQVTVAFPANGKYTLEADVTVPRHSSADKPGAPAHGYGVFRYSARVNVSAQPKVEFSSTRVEQGSPCCSRAFWTGRSHPSKQISAWPNSVTCLAERPRSSVCTTTGSPAIIPCA